MSNIGYLEGLQAQKAELLADLAAIERLISRASIPTNGQASVQAPKKWRLRKANGSQRHVFKPDPASTASRVINESRSVLDSIAGHALPFANLCQRLPRDLAGTAKQRQYVRMTLQRSGKRANLEYVDANCVRLRE